jgi:hypothetical protein
MALVHRDPRLSIGDLCAMFAVSRRMVARAIRAGRLPKPLPHPITGRPCWRKSVIAALDEGQEVRRAS